MSTFYRLTLNNPTPPLFAKACLWYVLVIGIPLHAYVALLVWSR